MIVCRAYNVLDALVVEISCVHEKTPESSHLVIREERRPYDGSADGALRALVDVFELARVVGESAQPCRTGLGWSD